MTHGTMSLKERINIVTTQNSLRLCSPSFLYGLLKEGQRGAQIPAD